MNLAERQEKMRLKHQGNYKSVRLEKNEIDKLCSRTDLKCPYCQKVPTRASKRTGELYPCKQCKRMSGQAVKYGITLHQFASMLREQNNKCAICRVDFDYSNRKTVPCIDHCHDLNHVRGILCHRCNVGISMFKEDDTILASAAKYVSLNRVDRNWWSKNTD